MPFYEYQCGACGHDLEVLQKVGAPALRKCPDCGRSTLKRLISAPVFRLKGSGWYETDFKSDADRKRNLAGDAEPEKTKEPATETAAKPEATTKEASPAAEAKLAAKPAPATPAPNGKTPKKAAAASRSRSARRGRKGS